MTRDEFIRRFPQASADTLARNPEAGGPPPGAQPEQAVRHEPLAALPGEKADGPRYVVRIRSYRTRLCDPDNLCGKAFVDCLRYAGIIPDDTAAIMDYSISQQKVKTKKEERTVVEVYET